MKHLLLTVVLLTTGLLPVLRADDDDRFMYKKLAFRRVEVPVYENEALTSQVRLDMAYAQQEVTNAEDWLKVSTGAVAYEIDLVFTLYPKNLSDWRTNYFELLNGRMQTLFKIDSALNSPDIQWNMVLQTEPTSEEEAKKFFHGFVIKYRPRKARVVKEVRSPSELKDLISGDAIIEDSTVYQVLERNPDWDRMLVVVDWTGSMYRYGAQLVHWYKIERYNNPDAVQHIVFFNDGNNKKTYQKHLGRTGGVYRSRSVETKEILHTMQYVMRKGNGGDAAENDVEAILTGLQYLEDFDEVILIADNKSDIRDLELLEEIDKPVRIILCDVRSFIHPHYIKLAKETGGSLHTLKKDMTEFE